MNIKKLIIGGFIGGIIFFLIGYLEYGVVLNNFYATHHSLPAPGHVYRSHIMFQYILLGNLFAGLLMSFVILKSNSKTVFEGLINAGIVGFLLCASVDSLSYSMAVLMSLKAILVEVVAYTFISAVAGAVITFIFSKMKSD